MENAYHFLLVCLALISLLDNNRELYCQAIANETLVVQSTAAMYDEWLVLKRLNLKMHRVPWTTVDPIAAEDAFQYHDQHRSIRRRGTRSAPPKKNYEKRK